MWESLIRLLIPRRYHWLLVKPQPISDEHKEWQRQFAKETVDWWREQSEQSRVMPEHLKWAPSLHIPKPEELKTLGSTKKDNDHERT